MKKQEIQNWKKRVYARTGGRGKGLEFLFAPIDRKADLHVHSDISDGIKSIEQIGNDAAEKGLQVLAITDHDTIKGPLMIANGQASLGKYRGKFVNGVEITSRLGNSRVEVLVYDFDVREAEKKIDNFEFPFLNRKFKIKRNVNNVLKRVEVVNRLGFAEKPLTINDFLGVELKNDDGMIDLKFFSELGLDAERDLNFSDKDFKQAVEYNGKTYAVNFDNFNLKMFQYIMNTEKGRNFVAGYKNASGEPITKFADFNRCVLQVDGNEFQIDDAEAWPTVDEVCRFAKETGGVALLAHAFSYGEKQGTPDQLVSGAIKAGVDGLETMHGFNTALQVEAIYNLCKDASLMISMGSDSHGYEKTRTGRDYSIGTAPGYEGAGALPDYIHETKLSTKTLHDIGEGLHRKKEEVSFDDGAFGK